MKAFLVANPKGGSGKSTLATNLAGYFASQHLDVMLGDIDRQQSAREWLAIRPFELPTIETWNIGPDNIARPPKGTSHVVLDTPAGLYGRALDKVLNCRRGSSSRYSRRCSTCWRRVIFSTPCFLKRSCARAKPMSR